MIVEGGRENGVKNKGYGTGRGTTENLCTGYGKGGRGLRKAVRGDKEKLL
jgi:hypothetical protein